ncbi:radical SAM family heme chaperone HemW [Cyanobium sp. Morenito 9A2]|uniref:radical SAM family heme chaperone HemW n=1 Tax=Cyanobium sp. Morenito 9A2 TaxID=2823718 RepID=UPI0020CD2A92|nr:radical SAM family heme chaperone HemW [Cyanobium sp. Morenito 9A2]MCP9848219.1 radical SAM family heme chaperone HemW [Cyanobium sp. Morenito 9A2]
MLQPRSAYLHIPFCHRRCFYCDFAVVPLGDHADGAHSGSIAEYLKWIETEIERSGGGPPLSTVYLGGGTPSLLTPAQVGTLLTALACRFGLAPGAEISLELDPASFDQGRLAGYLAAGINRVSLGGQSFDDAVLVRLGRRHRRGDLLEAAGWLRQAHRAGGLRSWSLDLIQGLPEQTLAHWGDQLNQALALCPPHLSIYDLTIEPGTVFERLQARGQLPLPEPDLGADLMELSAERLRAAGYGHYEISNYALPGHASRHNRVYWSGAGWWGFGLGATSAPFGRRLARPRTRETYAAWLGERLAPAKPLIELDPTAALPLPFDERVLVGLRRREGINMAELAAEHGLGPGELDLLRELCGPFITRGLLGIEGPRWRLSDPEGLALSNAVLRELLAWWEQRVAAAAPANP